MSDDLDFDMEVVDTEAAKESSHDVGQQTPSAGKEKKQTQSETPSAKLWPSIPEDWEMVTGNEVYDANPTRYTADGELDYIEMDALKTDLSDPKYVGRRDPSDYSGQMFAPGDTLFAQITPCTENGKAALVPKLRSEVGIGSTEFIVLSPNRAKILPDYLYYLSKSHPVHNYAVSRMRGSTGRQRVPVDVFRKELQIPLPPLPEQRKIASVLYAADHAIQKTEEIIEQAKRVKTGLLQDRIFDVSGPESVDRRFGPMKFRVPEEWDRVRLKEVTTLVTRGKQPTYAESGIPVINQKCIYWDGWYFKNSRYLDSEVAEEWKAKYFPEKGDVVINSTGRGTLGRAQVYRDSKRRAVDSHVTIVRPDQERLIPGYLRYLWESHRGQSLLYSMCVTGSTGQIELSKSKLKLLSIPLPPVEEQRRIVKMIEQFDQIVRKNRGYAKQLQDLKKGLMQDLLTGEVRTVDKAIEVLEEVQAHG